MDYFLVAMLEGMSCKSWPAQARIKSIKNSKIMTYITTCQIEEIFCERLTTLWWLASKITFPCCNPGFPGKEINYLSLYCWNILINDSCIFTIPFLQHTHHIHRERSIGRTDSECLLVPLFFLSIIIFSSLFLFAFFLSFTVLFFLFFVFVLYLSIFAVSLSSVFLCHFFLSFNYFLKIGPVVRAFVYNITDWSSSLTVRGEGLVLVRESFRSSCCLL